MDDTIGSLLGGDADTRELVDVATDEAEPPDVRRSAREALQEKLSAFDLVELMGGWEAHADFSGVKVVRTLEGLGHLVRAYVELVGPSEEIYTGIATAIGEDWHALLSAMAETIVDEGVEVAGPPTLGG